MGALLRRRESAAMLLRVLLVIAGLTILAGCGGGSSTTPTPTGAPAVNLSTTSLTFTTAVGVTSAAQVVTVTNSGNATLTFSGFTTSNSDFAQTNNCGTSLAAGGTCTVSVTFTSGTAVSGLIATLSIADNASGSPQTVSLNGTASTPTAAVSPSSLTFSTAVGVTTAAQTVTVTNSGNASLSISGISVSPSANFNQTNTCGSSVAAGANCTISVTFTSATAVSALAGTLTITDNASNSPQTVTLSGTAAVPTASVSPSSLTFSSQTVGSPSASQPVTLTNSSTVTLAVSSIAFTGANSGDFSETDNCVPAVSAGASCTINVTFNPTASGARAATLNINDNAAGSPQTVSLTGTGAVSSVSLSNTTLTFAAQTVGTSSTAQAVTLTNNGTSTLTITNIQLTTGSSDYSYTTTPSANCGGSLAASGICTISVTFTPSTTGTRTGTVTITDNANGVAGSTQTISLSGTGVAPTTTVSLSASTLALTGLLGSTPATSAAQTVTLTNTGTIPLTVSGITPAPSPIFAETDTCVGNNIAAGANCTISVTFTPTTGGTTTGTLTITDNATGSPQTVALTGLTNAVAVNVNLGPNGNYVNGIFTTVTICEPGTTTCDTVPNILVDTGSVGLRVLSGAIPDLTNLPPALDPTTGDPFYECVQYGDLSYTWGPIMMATLQLGGESALQLPSTTANSGVPIQVIAEGVDPPEVVYYATGSTTYATTDNPCLVYPGTLTDLTGGINDDTVANLGSNGILGVRNFVNDCGDYCAGTAGTVSVEGFPYLILDSGNYWLELIPDDEQASNPVAAFSTTDTNGVVLNLPSVPATGQATATGTLTFGIGTEPNNQVPSTATYYGLDCDGDFLQATFNGVTYDDVTGNDQTNCTPANSSFLDSGSNAMYFLDPGTLQSATGITVINCSDNGWYCPTSTLSLSPPNLGLTLYGMNPTTLGAGNSNTVSLSIANADTLFATGNAAFFNLAGTSITSGETSADDILDLGLPIFYDTQIFVGILGTNSTYPYGYWAF